jgi:hypothetical protein
LPPGEYIVACKITWQAGSNTAGGTVFQRVKVDAGENKKIVLTH